MKWRLVLGLFLGVAGVLGAGVAPAQDFPNKPVRMVVGVSPGSTPDILARVLGEGMSKLLGQPFIIENKPGANYLIAYGYVARQMPPDGYTVTVASVPGMAILPLTVKDLNFDPLKDLPPIVGLAKIRLVLGSAPHLPWKTFNEMITNAKANPGKLNYGVSTAPSWLLTALILRLSGAEMVHIAYKTTEQISQALTSGDVHAGLLSEGLAVPLGDRFRVLAVTGNQRSTLFPSVPTFAELGLPQIRGSGFSLNAAAAIPKAAADRLSGAALRTLQQPEARAALAKVGFEIVEQSGEVAARELAEEARLYADIAKQVGIRPE